jgi:acyl-CoA synthetase (AMP-forming)/AMP-acid ligase II
VPYIFPLTQEDSYLSFLPLAHIFETIAEVAILVNGGRIGFFQDNIKKLTDDMKDVEPTLFCAVPRVFLRMHQVVMAGVAEKNCLVKWYFNRAYNHQVEQTRRGLPVDKKYDSKVFAPLRERMGFTKVRMVVTGAAPMPPYLNEFLKVVTACPVLEGYGMTEVSVRTATCAASAIFHDRSRCHLILLPHVRLPLPRRSSRRPTTVCATPVRSCRAWRCDSSPSRTWDTSQRQRTVDRNAACLVRLELLAHASTLLPFSFL